VSKGWRSSGIFCGQEIQPDAIRISNALIIFANWAARQRTAASAAAPESFTTQQRRPVCRPAAEFQRGGCDDAKRSRPTSK